MMAAGSPGAALGRAFASLPPVAFGAPPRAVLGCIQIPTDFVLDREGPKLIEGVPGVELRLQKLRMDSDAIAADTFERAAGSLGAAAAVLRPPERCTAVGLACTSMAFTLGGPRVDAELRRACPAAATTDMARAQVAALRALGARRVALLTPYVEALAAANARTLEAEAGVNVRARATMGLEVDAQTTAVTPACIAAWARAVDATDADVLVVGCSAFRACDHGFVDALEADLGKPVVTSTQAFLWAMLRAAGVEDRIPGYGALLRRH